MFELGFIPIADMVIAALLPEILDTSFAAIMLLVMVPLVGSMASMFLGVHPYIKELRDLDISKKNSVKKFLAGLGLVFVPIMAWQFFVFNIPSGLTSNLFFIISAFGIFLISVMALSPYLIMIFQSTRPLEGSMRESLEDFCNENDYSLRDIKLLEAKGVKSANAVVAGTLPRFNYVFITDYLIENFSEDEIEAILAHELGHLEGKHLWIKGLASFLFFGIWMALILKADVLVPVINSLGIYGVMGASFGMIMLYFIGVQGLVSSKLEFRADNYAKKLKGEETTISALQKLAELNDMKKDSGKLFNLINLHPSIEDRVESLRDA